MRFWFIVLISSVVTPSIASALEFNEIMYNPEGTDSKREWLEVYNDGDGAVDLSTYGLFENSVNHGITYFSGPSEIAPGAYAIIAADAAEFDQEFNIGSDVSLYDSVFTLNNTGEEIRLLNDQENVVSLVSYTENLGANGDGNSLNRISNSWLPRKPSPGTAASEVEIETSTTSTARSSRMKVMTPADTAELPIDITVTVPEFGIAGQVLEFKVVGPNKHRYEWEFNTGEVVIKKSAQQNFKLPGNYSVKLTITDDGEQLYAKVFSVKVESPNLGLATGYYLDKRYLRISNKNSAPLALNNWQVYVGSDQYELPTELVLRPQDDYGFYLDHELAYPILVLNQDQVVVTQVTGTGNGDTQSSATQKNSEPNLIPAVDPAQSTTSLSLVSSPGAKNDDESTDSTDSYEDEQAELRAVFESYDELLTEEVELPTTSLTNSSDNSLRDQLLATPVSTSPDQKPNLFMNIALFMGLLVGGGLVLSTKKKAYAINKQSSGQGEDEDLAKDYTIIDEEDF